MIQANELRLNNLIMYGNMIYPVERITEASISVRLSSQSLRTARPHEFEPVPLSAEILRACGFDRDYDGNYRFQIEQWVFIWLFEYEIFNIGRGAQLAEYTRIEKLHQLQNAVHALTGFELTINLEKVKV